MHSTMAAWRACSTSADLMPKSTGPSSSKDGNGRLLERKCSPTLLVLLFTALASSSIREAMAAVQGQITSTRKVVQGWQTQAGCKDMAPFVHCYSRLQLRRRNHP